MKFAGYPEEILRTGPVCQRRFDRLVRYHVAESVGADQQHVSLEQFPVQGAHGQTAFGATAQAVQQQLARRRIAGVAALRLVSRQLAEHAASEAVGPAVAGIHQPGSAIVPDDTGQRTAHRKRLALIGGGAVEFHGDVVRRFACIVFETVRLDLVQRQLLFHLLQGEAAGHFPVLMAAHAIGDQQVEEAFGRYGDHQVGGVITQDHAADGQRILVVIPHKTFVADGLDIEFHSTVKSRVAMRTRSPFFRGNPRPDSRR